MRLYANLIFAALVPTLTHAQTGSWSMSSTPIVSIGDESGDPNYSFTRIARLKRLSDGRILATTNSDIRFFDQKGKFSSRAGGRGRGPGEFEYIQDLIVLPGDTLLVLDVARQQVWLTPQGKYVRRAALDFSPLTHDGWFSEGAWLLPDAQLLSMQFKNRENARELGRPPIRYTRFEPAARTVRPLIDLGGLRQITDGRMGGVQAYSPDARVAIGADRIYAGDNDSTTINSFSLDGKFLSAIRVADRETPVTKAHLDDYRRRNLEFAGSDAGRLERFEWGWKNVPNPKRHPYWDRALVDKVGNLWIASPKLPNTPESWSVFDRNGRKIASLTMPARFTAHEVGHDYVLGVAKDEDDVESIRMYSLNRNTRSR
jgi:hypothetical protein